MWLILVTLAQTKANKQNHSAYILKFSTKKELKGFPVDKLISLLASG